MVLGTAGGIGRHSFLFTLRLLSKRRGLTAPPRMKSIGIRKGTVVASLKETRPPYPVEKYIGVVEGAERGGARA